LTFFKKKLDMKHKVRITKYNNATKIKILPNKRISVGRVLEKDTFDEINTNNFFVEMTNYRKEGFPEKTRVVNQNVSNNNKIIVSGFYLTKESAYALYLALQHELQLSDLNNIDI